MLQFVLGGYDFVLNNKFRATHRLDSVLTKFVSRAARVCFWLIFVLDWLIGRACLWALFDLCRLILCLEGMVLCQKVFLHIACGLDFVVNCSRAVRELFFVLASSFSS